MRLQKTDTGVNFKMALKINPNLREKIAESGIDYVNKLNKYGEQISDIKLYDVVLDTNLFPKVKKTNIDNPMIKNTMDYYYYFREQEKNLGKFIYATCGDETHGYSMPNEPFIFSDIYGKDAAKKYAEFKKLDELGRAAELSKLLEKQELQRIIKQEKLTSQQQIEELMKKARREELNRAVNNLIDRYKTEQSSVIPEEEKTTENKSFWKKLLRLC